MKFALLSFLLFLPFVCGEVVDLGLDNFLEETVGKSVFIKFFAPWCEHCQDMAAAWEQLAADYDDQEIALVGEVNCEEQFDLCDELDIEEFPTIKWGDPNNLEDYDSSASREYEELAIFAETFINQPVCSTTYPEACSKEEQSAMEDFALMSSEELKTLTNEIEDIAVDLQTKLIEDYERLTKEYETLMKKHNEQVQELQDRHHYKFMKEILEQKLFGEEADLVDQTI